MVKTLERNRQRKMAEYKAREKRVFHKELMHWFVEFIKEGKIENRVMMSDSYKYSHVDAYEEGVSSMFDYAEVRSSKFFTQTQFATLQYYLKEYFTFPITQYEVDEAYMYLKAHGAPFDKAGWDHIVQELDGRLPIRIRAVQEGKLVPTGNVLFTIESTDARVFWIASWLETTLMKVWYGCNIATRTYNIKQILMGYAEATSDNPFVDYTLHNFGDRGSSSVESAGIGGIAHLINFKGTDNFNAIKYVHKYYSFITIEAIGHSIPALEHSTITSWGKVREFEMFLNFMEENKGRAIIAMVMDSYDYFNAVEIITSDKRFTDKINSDEYPIVVMRPDSGDPRDIIPQTIDIMEKNNVPYTTNKKGYKVWNKIRIIWGDGINEEAIIAMLNILKERGYSSENIAFGMGGALMQGNESTSNNRDTQGFAIKNGSVTINGEERDVFKDPITEPTKKSKKGILGFYYNEETNSYITQRATDPIPNGYEDALYIIYENGEVITEWTFDEVREAA